MRAETGIVLLSQFSLWFFTAAIVFLNVKTRYDGLCDKDGCDFHNWRMGDKSFFGPGSNFKVLKQN